MLLLSIRYRIVLSFKLGFTFSVHHHWRCLIVWRVIWIVSAVVMSHFLHTTIDCDRPLPCILDYITHAKVLSVLTLLWVFSHLVSIDIHWIVHTTVTPEIIIICLLLSSHLILSIIKFRICSAHLHFLISQLYLNLLQILGSISTDSSIWLHRWTLSSLILDTVLIIVVYVDNYVVMYCCTVVFVN